MQRAAHVVALEVQQVVCTHATAALRRSASQSACRPGLHLLPLLLLLLQLLLLLLLLPVLLLLRRRRLSVGRPAWRPVSAPKSLGEAAPAAAAAPATAPPTAPLPAALRVPPTILQKGAQLHRSIRCCI